MGEVIVPFLVGAGTAAATSAIAGKPKAVKPPPVPAPLAPVATADTKQAGEQVRRRAPSGRAETFITGDLTPKTKKKQLLG
jgi:hypothetical protein